MSGTHIGVDIAGPDGHGDHTELTIRVVLDPFVTTVIDRDYPLHAAATAAADEYSYALATIAEHAVRAAIAYDKAYAIINSIPAVAS